MIRTSKRDELKDFLDKNNIQTGIHYPISICELQCYENKYNKSQFKNTIENSNKILSLPMYPSLKEDVIEYISNKIILFFNM